MILTDHVSIANFISQYGCDRHKMIFVYGKRLFETNFEDYLTCPEQEPIDESQS